MKEPKIKTVQYYSRRQITQILHSVNFLDFFAKSHDEILKIKSGQKSTLRNNVIPSS